MGRLIIKATHGTRVVDTITNEVISYCGDFYASIKAYETGKGICALSEDDMVSISEGASPETLGYTRETLRKEVKEYVEDAIGGSASDEMIDDVCIDILRNTTGEDVMTTLDCFLSNDDYFVYLSEDKLS